MEHKPLLDDLQSTKIKDTNATFKANHKNYLVAAIILFGVYAVLYLMLNSENGMPWFENLKMVVITNLQLAPMVALFTSLFFAFIPYQQFTWAQKYPRAVLWVLIVWYAVVSIILFFMLIFNRLGLMDSF